MYTRNIIIILCNNNNNNSNNNNDLCGIVFSLIQGIVNILKGNKISDIFPELINNRSK